jgi:hypothetical protein
MLEEEQLARFFSPAAKQQETSLDLRLPMVCFMNGNLPNALLTKHKMLHKNSTTVGQSIERTT